MKVESARVGRQGLGQVQLAKCFAIAAPQPLNALEAGAVIQPPSAALLIELRGGQCRSAAITNALEIHGANHPVVRTGNAPPRVLCPRRFATLRRRRCAG